MPERRVETRKRKAENDSMNNGFFDNGLLGPDVPAHIRGIRCDVKNCLYHDGDSYCTADRIAIGPSFATSCTDTVCATFRPKARK